MASRQWRSLYARATLALALTSSLAFVGCADVEGDDAQSTELLQAVADPTAPCTDGGTGEPEDDGGEQEPPDDGGTEQPPRQDLGKGNGRDVITIGDSWMSLFTSGIQQSLVRASGQRYRTYGVAGTRLLNGQIPGQYARAKRENPDIKTVVMTGGGNDVLMTGLQSDCARGGTRCKEQLAKIGQALADLWAQMGRDGVKDVIHILYSSDAGSGVKEGAANNQGLADLCKKASPVRCHLLPTDDLVRGDLRLDGIHPSNAAYDRIGRAVYQLMEREGMRR